MTITQYLKCMPIKRREKHINAIADEGARWAKFDAIEFIRKRKNRRRRLTIRRLCETAGYHRTHYIKAILGIGVPSMQVLNEFEEALMRF